VSEFQISNEQSQSFLSSLGIIDVEHSSSGLQVLIRSALENVPFTNIMMLVRPKRSPTHHEIIDDMVSLKGGPCGHYNPFMNEVLRHQGFDSNLVAGWIDGKLSHMAIIVNLNGEEWWADFGNGHPYLSPIKLGSKKVKCHAGLSYRIMMNPDGSYSLEHRLPNLKDYKENYRFTTDAVPFSFFDKMVESHYTIPGFGPFLGGVRFIRFPEGEMFAVRDDVLMITTAGMLAKEKIGSVEEMERIISTGFKQATYPLRAGLGVLGWC
jgi:arylamine N-acetyltransferase